VRRPRAGGQRDQEANGSKLVYQPPPIAAASSLARHNHDFPDVDAQPDRGCTGCSKNGRTLALDISIEPQPL
jgi:hypothetical protein